MSDLMKEFDGLKRKVPDCKFVLPGSGQEILFRPFSTEDQKSILKSMEKRDIELVNEAFDALLRKNVLNENFSPLDLYSKDREALLVEFRRNSVKEEYNHTWKCDKTIEDRHDGREKVCGQENELVFPLSKIEPKKLESSTECKEITLSDVDGCTLFLGMTTRRDEKEVLRYVKSHSKDMKDNDQSSAELMHATLASVIKKIQIGDKVRENVKFEDKISLVGRLSILDRNKIKDYITTLETYGFDFTIKDCVCKKCAAVQEVDVQWISFFGM